MENWLLEDKQGNGSLTLRLILLRSKVLWKELDKAG